MTSDEMRKIGRVFAELTAATEDARLVAYKLFCLKTELEHLLTSATRTLDIGDSGVIEKGTDNGDQLNR